MKQANVLRRVGKQVRVRNERGRWAQKCNGSNALDSGMLACWCMLPTGRTAAVAAHEYRKSICNSKLHTSGKRLCVGRVGTRTVTECQQGGIITSSLLQAAPQQEQHKPLARRSRCTQALDGGGLGLGWSTSAACSLLLASLLLAALATCAGRHRAAAARCGAVLLLGI